jgi:hypothetical protein
MPAKEEKSLTAKVAEDAMGPTIKSIPREEREDNAKYEMAAVGVRLGHLADSAS